MSALSTRYSPSFALVQAHLWLGVAGLCAFAAALLLRAAELRGYFFQPLLLGLVHLGVLGWLLPIALGAAHQLVPVVFEVKVRSEGLAWTAYALYLAGIALFIPSMWNLDRFPGLFLPIGGTLAALAVCLYCANLLTTIASTTVRNVTGPYVIASLLYLIIAVLLGATMAWNLWRPFLPFSHLMLLRGHALWAGLGFFGLLIMGIGYRLLEMFLLSHGASERAGWIALVAINVALVELFVAFLYGSPAWAMGLGLLAAGVGVGAFYGQVWAIWRRRMQRKPDVAWKHTFASFAYLGVALLACGTLALAPLEESWRDRLGLVFGLAAIPGFIGAVVVGQLYKILPFLVWLHHFSRWVGLKKVPTAAQLLPEGPKRLQYLANHLGLVALGTGVLADLPSLRVAGAASFAFSAALFARNLGVIATRRP